MGKWLSNQLWNTSLPWLLGLFFIGTGFYYITTSTLQVHTQQLAQLQLELKETRDAARLARESTRSEFLTESKATAAGIAELNKLTAVMGNTLLGVQKELEKIGLRLDSAVVTPPRR